MKPKNLLIYYGYPNSFNSGSNSWDNEKVAQDMARYDLIVLGDAIQTIRDSGTHDGSDGASTLSDSTKSWTTNEHNNEKLVNVTDGSTTTVTGNTSTTVTGTLSGGTDNDWDSGDEYLIADHPDYLNTRIITKRIKELKPSALIFGYVTTNQSYSDFIGKVDDWLHLDIDGIFMDESGYDYGSTSTNGRKAFNDKVDYVHSKGLICFVNAWRPDHIIGENEDSSYPDSTWNSDGLDSNLNSDDWYLMESWPINTTSYTSSTPNGYESKSDWKTRGDRVFELKELYDFNVAASGIINDGNADETGLFHFLYVSALMYECEAVGSSDTSYGSSSAKSQFYSRPDIEGIEWQTNFVDNIKVDENDSDVYIKYIGFGKLKLDFSNNNQDSTITKL